MCVEVRMLAPTRLVAPVLVRTDGRVGARCVRVRVRVPRCTATHAVLVRCAALRCAAPVRCAAHARGGDRTPRRTCKHVRAHAFSVHFSSHSRTASAESSPSGLMYHPSSSTLGLPSSILTVLPRPSTSIRNADETWIWSRRNSDEVSHLSPIRPATQNSASFDVAPAMSCQCSNTPSCIVDIVYRGDDWGLSRGFLFMQTRQSLAWINR